MSLPPPNTPENCHIRAQVNRDRGNERMAQMYESRARELELLAKLRARTEYKTITVKGRKYRVSLSYDDQGEWTANAHASGSVMPDAYVSGHPDRETCLQAITDHLKGRSRA